LSEEYSLEASYKVVGPLYPVLVDGKGNVVDGFHRRKVDPNWPVQVLPWVKTREDQLVARIAANSCRRSVSKEERKKELTELGTIMLNRGVPRGRIVEEIAEKTGLSTQYVRSLLPGYLKLEEKVKAAERGWKAAREKTAEKASFAERGENLLFSEEQKKAPFGESGEILPSRGMREISAFVEPVPDLGRVELVKQEMLKEQAKIEQLKEVYTAQLVDFANFRIGHVLRDLDKAYDPAFLGKAVRELIAIVWRVVSGNRELMEAVKAEFDEALKKMQ
jgi:hypothetical protein